MVRSLREIRISMFGLGARFVVANIFTRANLALWTWDLMVFFLGK